MARILDSGRNNRSQATSKAKIKGGTRSSPRFKSSTSNTHPSASIVTTLVVGEKIPTTGNFTARLRLQDGTPKTLMGLLDESESGIVVWTFKPRAEDEGISPHLSHTTFPIYPSTNLVFRPTVTPQENNIQHQTNIQACDFASEIINSSYAGPGLNMPVYGLTTSSAATIASLQHRKDEIYCDLLSDSGGKLLRAMGYMDAKGQVKRGAFVISKDGTILMRKTGGTMFNVADGVFRVLKAVLKAKSMVGRVKVPY